MTQRQWLTIGGAGITFGAAGAIGIATSTSWLFGVDIALIAGGLVAGLMLIMQRRPSSPAQLKHENGDGARVSTQLLEEAHREFRDIATEAAEQAITNAAGVETMRLATFRLGQARQRMCTRTERIWADVASLDASQTVVPAVTVLDELAGELMSQSQSLMLALDAGDFDSVVTRQGELDRTLQQLLIWVDRVQSTDRADSAHGRRADPPGLPDV